MIVFELADEAKARADSIGMEEMGSNKQDEKRDAKQDEDPRTSERKRRGMMYCMNDVPPWYLCVILGIQHYLTMFGAPVTYPYLVGSKLCIRESDPSRGYIVSTIFFMSGLSTFLQSTFGSRLPIIQGASFAYLIPTLSILNLPKWKCPALNKDGLINETYFSTEEEWQDAWQSRMREVQGAIIGASLFEIVIGATGLIGFLLRWITPLVIAPIITLLQLGLVENVASTMSGHWGVAGLTIAVLTLFSQYLNNISVPLCAYRKKGYWRIFRAPLFKLFPVIFTIVLVWIFCTILTVTDVFPEGNKARTDFRIKTLHDSPWIRIPYPGQWGAPTISTAAVFGMLAGAVSSIIESIGDYYACARMIGEPPPPIHAVNRGIFMEGFSSTLSGVWGSGCALTSYSENIGALGITKVGSRRVIQYGAAVMVILGVVGKFGGLFVTIPDPVVGGILCVMCGMVTGVGISNVQFVDLNSSRNLFVIGSSVFMGLCISRWVLANPDSIKTGVEAIDQILTVLLSTSLFVGGVVGFILDNTVPGTMQERGLVQWYENTRESSDTVEGQDSYRLPCGMGIINRLRFLRYFPISPSYRGGCSKNQNN